MYQTPGPGEMNGPWMHRADTKRTMEFSGLGIHRNFQTIMLIPMDRQVKKRYEVPRYGLYFELPKATFRPEDLSETMPTGHVSR